MSAARRRQTVLAILRTDATFERQLVRGEPAWVGKCIHCQARLVVALDGETEGGATIEHIVPRNHGGTDALDNLALACARCNALKGKRLDHRRRDDPTLTEVIDVLRTRRRARWRDAPA
jgi:5-methylcytosine-specific restriction endonuclease McrA